MLDIVMPDASGTEGVTRMLRVAGTTPILILSFNAENAYAARLRCRWASRDTCPRTAQAPNW